MKPLYIFIACMWLFACSSDTQEARSLQELMDADIAFSDMSRANGMNHAFGFYSAENVVLLRPESMPVVGKSALISLMEQNDDSALQLTWEPSDGMVSRSGDMGYTYGVFTMKLKNGGPTQQGTYVSVWIKEKGSWKFVLDTGNDGLGK